MDIRSILNKLDNVVLSEEITLQDVEAAVKGKEKDEQGRAEILNDLAWKNKLPGLYDPISGNFVAKQSQPQGMGGQGRYNIASTGSERSDRALADLGLIPDNANTSTALGRWFRGDDKDQYSQDIKNKSSTVVTGQQVSKFKSETLPKLKDLVSQLNAAVAKIKGSSSSQSSGFGIKVPGVTESSIFESLLREFQDEVIDQNIDEADPVNPEIAKMASGQGSQGEIKLSPEVKTIYDELKALLTTAEKSNVTKDPEIAKEIQTARDAIAAAERDGVEKPAQATATTTPSTTTPSTDKEKSDAYNLVPPKTEPKMPADSDKSKEQRIARVKELLAKAKAPAAAPSTASAPAAPKTESMSELIARVQRIAEGRIDEALTADEYKELQTYAAGLKTEFPDDPDIQALTKQALELPSQWKSDEKPSDPTKPDAKKVAGADPKIQKIQQQLKDLGVDPGPVDGKMGPKTIAGIKAFQTMANLKADGKVGPDTEKALADGKNVVARSKLTTSLAAIEKIVAKYKIAESYDISEEDVLAMTEEEARAFVLKNIKYFSESEQIAIMRDALTEAPVPAVPGQGGALTVPGGPRPNPNVIDVPFKDVTPKPGWGQRAMNFVKGVGKSFSRKAQAATAGVALTLGALWKGFSGGDIEMDPADLAELQNHLKVLDQYGQDPTIKSGLPADVQKRLDAVIAKLGKLKSAKAKAPVKMAASGTPTTDTMGNISNTPAA